MRRQAMSHTAAITTMPIATPWKMFMSERQHPPPPGSGVQAEMFWTPVLKPEYALRSAGMVCQASHGADANEQRQQGGTR